jgi:hypothetical protein
MNQQFVGNAPSLLLKQADRTLQVDCVPEDDCGHYQAKSAHAIPLMLISQNHFFIRPLRWKECETVFGGYLFSDSILESSAA